MPGKNFGPMLRFDELVAEMKQCRSNEDYSALLKQYEEQNSLYSQAGPKEIRQWLATADRGGDRPEQDLNEEWDLDNIEEAQRGIEADEPTIQLPELTGGEIARRQQLSQNVRETFIRGATDSLMAGLDQMDAHPAIAALYYFCSAEEKGFVIEKLAKDPQSQELKDFIVGKIIGLQEKIMTERLDLSDEGLAKNAKDILFASELMDNLEALCDGTAFGGEDVIGNDENGQIYKNYLRGIAQREGPQLAAAKLRLEIIANPYYAVFPEEELLEMGPEQLKALSDRVDRKLQELPGAKRRGEPEANAERDEALEGEEPEEKKDPVKDEDSLRAYFNLLVLRSQQTPQVLESLIRGKLIERNLSPEDVLFLDENGEIVKMRGEGDQRVPISVEEMGMRLYHSPNEKFTCVRRAVGEDGQLQAGSTIAEFMYDGKAADPSLEYNSAQALRRVSRQTQTLANRLEDVGNVWFGSEEFEAVRSSMEAMLALTGKYRGNTSLKGEGADALREALENVMSASSGYLDMKQHQRGTLNVTKKNELGRIEAVKAVQEFAENSLAALGPTFNPGEEAARDMALSGQVPTTRMSRMKVHAEIQKNEFLGDNAGKELRELYALNCGSLDYLALYAGAGIPVAPEHKEQVYESMAAVVAFRMIQSDRNQSGSSKLDTEVLQKVGVHGMIQSICENQKFRELAGDMSPKALDAFMTRDGSGTICKGMSGEQVTFHAYKGPQQEEVKEQEIKPKEMDSNQIKPANGPIPGCG